MLALIPVCRLGREMFHSRVGWLAALLMAILPFQVYYAREARWYALVILKSRIWVMSLPDTLDSSRQALVAQIGARYLCELDADFREVRVSLYVAKR
jgi:hypothetical protein